jgi:hypothetical protein
LKIKPISEAINIKRISYDEDAQIFNEHKRDLFITGLKIFIKANNIKARSIDKLKETSILIDNNFFIVFELDGNEDRIEIDYYHIENERKLLVKDKESIALGIDHILGIDGNYADNIEKILSFRTKDKLIQYFKNRGISEDFIEELEELKEKEVKEEEILKVCTQLPLQKDIERMDGQIITGDTKEMEIWDDEEQAKEFVSSEYPIAQPKQQLRSEKPSVSSSSRGKEQRERKQGERAEEVVEGELREMPGNEWEIKRKKENADILLIHKESGSKFYIEVKSSSRLEKAEIHWSEVQVNTAREKESKYILAVVFGMENLDSDNRRVIWIVDPYHKLKQKLNRVEGKWEWRGEVVTGVKPWEKPSDIPQIEPSRFIFVVKLDYQLAEKIGIIGIKGLERAIIIEESGASC